MRLRQSSFTLLAALIVRFLWLIPFVSSKTYYVTPTRNIPCPEDARPCLTFSQYAAKPSDYFASNSSLILLPGNHSLDLDLFVGNLSSFNMVGNSASNTSTVSCSKTTTIKLNSVTDVHITQVDFYGCNVIVNSALRFLLVDCIVHGRSNFESGVQILHTMSANVSDSSFIFNTGANGLGSISSYNSTIYLSGGMFYRNVADNGTGGAIFSMNCTIEIESSKFVGNSATELGGACAFYIGQDDGYFCIDNSQFSYNSAEMSGGAIYVQANETTKPHCYSITNSQFIGNQAKFIGGAIAVDWHVGQTLYYINNTQFFNNTSANEAGAISLFGNNIVHLSNALFINNTAQFFSGALMMRTALSSVGAIHISNTKFVHNTARIGGALFISGCTNTSISNTQFVSNNAFQIGGALVIDNFINAPEICNLTTLVHNSKFLHNTAHVSGGAILIELVSGQIHFTGINKFFRNAALVGGAIYTQSAENITSTGSLNIHENTGRGFSVLLLINSTWSFLGNLSFSNNTGSLFAIRFSNVTFGGFVHFFNNSPDNPYDAPYQEGGAVTSFLSQFFFIGTTTFIKNEADNGGAILAKESKLYVYGDVTIGHNLAASGGGIYAYQSELNFWGKVNISSNSALGNGSGGGIHLSSTTAKVFDGIILFRNNTASQGGGAFLESNAKLFITKVHNECIVDSPMWCYRSTDVSKWLRIEFYDNTADYGGALYVKDDSNFGTCNAFPYHADSDNVEGNKNGECFLQDLSSGYFLSTISAEMNVVNTYFTNNSAGVAGGTIYGGLLDRCIVSPFSEVRAKYPNSSDGITFILDATNLQREDLTQAIISSDSVRVCFCRDNQLDCSYQPGTLKIRKGETFKVSLVAVDQCNNTTPNATVHSFLSSSHSGLREGQSIQKTRDNCTQLTYNAFSPKQSSSEQLHIYAEGPCKDLGISKRTINVTFISCPNGFVESNQEGCQCDPLLYPKYVQNCSIDLNSVLRKENVWISITEQHHYITYQHCPSDYCVHQLVYVNLNVPNGSDAQCAFNRTGKLCGSCEDGLSLSLGSSRCISCSNNWLALLIVFAVAGLALVAFLLVCNLTVAVGTINSLIFYANIIAANRATFMFFEKPNVATVFIAWLNLDFGIETCFFDGMDGYAKTWLQLAFPCYTISLVVAIIVICQYSRKFAKAISNLNPVATLATLILLSYTKLLRTIIASLSYATLQTSNGLRDSVWLIDANVPYLRGIHTLLFTAALFIILVGLLYTFLLLLWKWLVRLPNWKLFRWTRNTKLHSFMDAYVSPYTGKHRYWPGLLLLVRAVLYIVSALTDTTGGRTFNLLFIVCVGTSLVSLNGLAGTTLIYKSRLLNALEISFLFNLIIFSAATQFLLKSGRSHQNALAYTSILIAFVTFLAILTYHSYVFVIKKHCLSRKIKRARVAVVPVERQNFHEEAKPLLLEEEEEKDLEEDLMEDNELRAPLDMIDEDPTTEDYENCPVVNPLPPPRKPQVITYSEVVIRRN